MSQNKIDALYILTAAIIIMILAIILAYVMLLTERERTNVYRQEVIANITKEEFTQQLISYNEALEQNISNLESSVAEDKIIINLLKAKLNDSARIEISPFSKIRKEDIRVFEDKIVIYVNKAFPVSFSDSKSMYPFINEKTLALEIMPAACEELNKGDVIGFESKTLNTTVIHRIIETGNDDEGWYAITKGDANLAIDPGKVRFGDVKGVLVGLIY
jgi:signal peptidase I